VETIGWDLSGKQWELIMLAGFPDIPLSLPHSKESQRLRGEI